MSDNSSLKPGANVGRYVLERPLGSGGMGDVWLARDRELGRPAALKFLKGSDPEELARFRREAQAVASLNHPNIGSIYESGDGFIAMQFVDGQTLATYPRDNRRRMVELIRDAARALHHAHAHGIIHRDLKPANLMVDRDGRVFVMDFG